jgi:hypothetical protein
MIKEVVKITVFNSLDRVLEGMGSCLAFGRRVGRGEHGEGSGTFVIPPVGTTGVWRAGVSRKKGS